MRSLLENGNPLGRTRAKVAELMARGLSQAQIAGKLGISKPTVCFHMLAGGVDRAPLERDA